MRYIDADALKDWSEIVPLTGDGGIDINDFDEKLASMPAADVATVRHGQWEQDEIAHGLNVWLCSACGQPTQLLDGDVSAKTPYCPNCGARMDGGNDA